jgi:hypothetical protein
MPGLAHRKTAPNVAVGSTGTPIGLRIVTHGRGQLFRGAVRNTLAKSTARRGMRYVVNFCAFEFTVTSSRGERVVLLHGSHWHVCIIQ